MAPLAAPRSAAVSLKLPLRLSLVPPTPGALVPLILVPLVRLARRSASNEVNKRNYFVTTIFTGEAFDLLGERLLSSISYIHSLRIIYLLCRKTQRAE